MTTPSSDKLFAGSIPQIYDTYLVPLIFEPYAADLAGRVAAIQPRHLLELAAGTGVVTRAMAASVPFNTTIVATDLNQPMLDRAIAVGTRRPVLWQQADAMQLPFKDGQFDLVVCQFGVMFFPDKSAAFAEARRVLAPGGTLLFNVWDRIEENDFPHVVAQALAELFPSDPPAFMERTPHGYHDKRRIEQDLRQGGFQRAPMIDTVALRSRASSPHIVAMAFCQGTPMRNEIEARDPAALQRATDFCAAALERKFGRTDLEGRIQAHVVAVTV